MFCTECGAAVAASAKFCSSCGTGLAGHEATQARSGSLVEIVLGPDPLLAETAKQRIIDTVDLVAMNECVARSITSGDLAAAEFWYQEIITAPGASTSIIAEGILAYCRDILEPAGRLSETELYLQTLASLDHAPTRAGLMANQERIAERRTAEGRPRQAYTDEWISVSPAVDLDPNSSPRAQYLRSIAWVDNAARAGKLDGLNDPSRAEFMPDVVGLTIGLRSGLSRGSGDVEAGIQGACDWIAAQQSSLASGAGSATTVAMLAAAQHALAAEDFAEAEARYVGVLMWSRGISSALRTAVLEYSQRVLVPDGRFAVAELLLTELALADPAAPRDQIGAALEAVRTARASRNIPRCRYSHDWMFSIVRSAGNSGSRLYNETISSLHDTASEQSQLIDHGDEQHFTLLAEFLGDYDANDAPGWEIRFQAVVDWLAFERGTINVPDPTTNRLGTDVGNTFNERGNRHLAEPVTAAFGALHGVNDDFILATLNVSENLGKEDNSGSRTVHCLVFTRDRVGIFNLGRSVVVIPRNDVTGIGVGDSSHRQIYGGWGSQDSSWVSFTLQRRGGASYTRHFNLGSDEQTINHNRSWLQSRLDDIGAAGYPVTAGPGRDSTGGYQTSYGVGFIS